MGDERSELTLALAEAAFAGDCDAVRLLLARGADVNGRAGHWGRTAIHSAIEGCQLEAMKVLLDGGADIESRATEAGGGWTPLQHAVDIETDVASRGPGGRFSGLFGGDVSMTRLLLERGADPWAAPPTPDYNPLTDGNARAFRPLRRLLDEYGGPEGAPLGGIGGVVLRLCRWGWRR